MFWTVVWALIVVFWVLPIVISFFFFGISLILVSIQMLIEKIKE